jgi:hypothetical protein
MSANALRVEDHPEWPLALNVGNRFSLNAVEQVRLLRPQVSSPSTTAEVSWIGPTFARLQEVALLEDDWDQRGSAAVRGDALSFAWFFLRQVMPPTALSPGIVPLGHGGVQLLWHNQRCDLEVEVIGPNNMIAYYFDKLTGHEDEFAVTNEFSRITDILWSHFKS